MLLKRHSRRFFSKYPIHGHINCSASVSCSRRAYNCQGSSQCSLWIHLPNSTTLPEAISPLDVNLKISWTLGSFFVRGPCPLYSLNSLKSSHSVIIASRRLGHDLVRCLWDDGFTRYNQIKCCTHCGPFVRKFTAKQQMVQKLLKQAR